MRVLLCLGVLASLLVSCASPTTKNSVIKEAAGAATSPEDYGFLRVYSASETMNDGPVTYKAHSPYVIYTTGGVLVDQVQNRSGTGDSEPVRVKLPVGDYLIQARSQTAGWVSIPVTIEPGLASSIHIDDSWKMPDQLVTKTPLIEKADGEAIGWYGEPTIEF